MAEATADRQAEIIAFLSDPATYGDGMPDVGRIDTHAAIVFLAGGDVYKIKRDIRFPFLDFSTLEQRRIACEREVELNRLTAPSLYLGTVPVTRRADGKLSLGGRGEPVEWAVHMRRFDENATLDRLAGAGRIDIDLIERLAGRVVDLHAKAPAVRVDNAAGRVAQVARENIEELRSSSERFSPERVDRLADLTGYSLDRHAGLIAARAGNGFVRRCHGDLHLGNVALIDGEPVIFDALEFDDGLATIDVLYDLAFLVMDLWERGLRQAANHVLNRWLDGRGRDDDLPGLALLPLYLSMRAAIRAKVAAARCARLSGAAKAAAADEADGMFAAACAFLEPPPARLVAIGGLSGTGKTTIARAVAADLGPAPGAVIVRSDVVRKAMFGVPETERLGPDAYTRAAGARVYERMEAAAATVLRAGHAAVLDAVHARPAERSAARAVADAAGVRFDGIWLEAGAQSLRARIEARHGDASDATAEVLHRQMELDTGTIDWSTVDTGGGRETAVAHASRVLGLAEPNGPAGHRK